MGAIATGFLILASSNTQKYMIIAKILYQLKKYIEEFLFLLIIVNWCIINKEAIQCVKTWLS